MNNVRFLPHSQMRDALAKMLASGDYAVELIDAEDPELRGMIRAFDQLHSKSKDLSYMKFCAWYGIRNLERELMCAVGFEENYSRAEGFWMYVVHTVCRKSKVAKLSYGHLLDWIGDIPYLIRGVIYLDNPRLLKVAENRHWQIEGWVVKKKGRV